MIPIPEKPSPIRLLGARVHITPLERKAARQSAGGILIHPSADDDAKQWMVLGVGPGAWQKRKGKKRVWIVPEVNPGDRVIVDTGLGGTALPDGTWVLDYRAGQFLLKW
jgi:co-chaperonin GroES (HSP10)